MYRFMKVYISLTSVNKYCGYEKNNTKKFLGVPEKKFGNFNMREDYQPQQPPHRIRDDNTPCGMLASLQLRCCAALSQFYSFYSLLSSFNT